MWTYDQKQNREPDAHLLVILQVGFLIVVAPCAKLPEAAHTHEVALVVDEENPEVASWIVVDDTATEWEKATHYLLDLLNWLLLQQKRSETKKRDAYSLHRQLHKVPHFLLHRYILAKNKLTDVE